MTSRSKEQIERIYRAAVEAVLPDVAIERVLRPPEGGRIDVAGRDYDLPDQGVYAIAIGKASTGMLRTTAGILGDLLVDAIAVSKQPDGEGLDRFELHTGSHPVPDERSLAAGEAVLDFASRVPEGALVICLISGGGSALVEALRDGVTLDDLQGVTRKLLSGGADIYELNAVRSRLSRIKGGGLLGALAHTSVVNLIISDVLGDDPGAIASGPTVSPSRGTDADEVASRYSVTLRLPEAISRPREAPQTEIIATLRIALGAAAKAAESEGLAPMILSESIEGEARHAGRIFAAIAADSAAGRSSLSKGACLLAGGETTVTVRGDGVGGRNTEAALAAALRLMGTCGATIGFLATDGDDGVADAAGGIVDGATIMAEDRVDALRALDENDSYTFLAARGATWSPGPTGTNVNDLLIAAIDRE